jgi:hypothetical protein
MAGCGEMVEASRDEVAEFDEQHREFLVMTELKIADIVKLAHLISPAKWSGLKIPAGKAIIFTPRFGQLKNHVICKRIKGHHTHRHEAIIDYAALISLADLLAFLETAGPEWDWLRSFAARWQKFCRSGARYGKRRKRKEDADVERKKESEYQRIKMHADTLRRRYEGWSEEKIAKQIKTNIGSRYAVSTIRQIIGGRYKPANN